MSDFMITVRNNASGKFGTNPGVASFLNIPDAATTPLPSHAIKPKSQWFDQVLKAAETGRTVLGAGNNPSGDILIFVHGFNVDMKSLLERHRQLHALLIRQGFKGAFVSFDWPSEASAFQYLNDRSDAQKTAHQLVDDCITAFVARQTPDCAINLHVLAHSMGGFVIREAFDSAKYKKVVDEKNWTVSQLMFVDADVSAASFESGNPQTLEMLKHSVRFTNYSNPFDSVLKISNAKRAGLASRVGRVGLPGDIAPNAINVDCGDHYEAIKNTIPGNDVLELKSHSWFYGDATFAKDVVYTIEGDIDRHKIPTRKLVDGKLYMIP